MEVQVENEKAPSYNITEEAKSVSVPAEFSLQSLIIDAFHGRGFDKIKEYLQQNENSSNQKYNKFLLTHLDRLINKELDKNEFQYVSLLLKCIQRFFTENRKEDEQLLIQQGLVPKMVSWFERTIGFLNFGELTTISLVQVLEDLFNTALVISKCSHKGKIQLLDSFLFDLGLLVADKTINYLIRQEGLRTLNSILEKLPQEEREKFPLSDNNCFLMKGLAKAIPETGDYELQIALSEALCRMVSKKSRADLAHRWFEDDIIASAFKEIRDREFETDSRKFLNCLNDRLGDKRRVCTFPCVAAFVDEYELKKPHDENLEEFWIDFNIESKSITFYIDNTEGLLWDSVRLLKEAIGGFYVREAEKKKVLIIYLKKSLLFNNKEVKKIEMHFDLQSNILKTCMKVFGKDKYLSNPDETKKEEPPEMSESFEEEDTVEILSCHEEESAQEPVCQEESVNGAKTDSLYESSQLVEKSATTKNVVNNTSANLLDLEDPNQEVIASKWNSLDGLKEMDKILVPKLNEEPSCSNSFVSLTPQTFQEDLLKVDGFEKGRKGTISSKNISETKENPYDFENSSDTVYSQVVVEAKQRMLSHKMSSLKKRDSSTFSSYKSQGKGKLFDDLRKHLSSESNYESSSDISGSSWINSQKKKKLKTYSKQKKPRVRRKVRILPLLFSSSSSDHQNATPVWKRTSRQKKEKNPDFPVVIFQSSTAFLTPEDSTKKKPFQSVTPLEDSSSPEHSEVTDNLTKSAKSSMETTKLKRKLQNVGASDPYDSTLIKTKQSKLEEDNTPFSPVALMPGENPFCSASQVLPDSLGESAVISTLENYTKHLKKKFESRNKKKDICSRDAMKASKKLTMLLNQIHQCRLDKIEQFHKSVLQELDNFKKDVQALKDLEKEVLDFWKEQFTKLNSFCDRQMQSLNRMRKR
ncbi:synaptonemal complex protein 2-like [Monodelphis domestica]|uniref:synaptonemal complex protein 2-like n=1 Tax=Monodelphis domestica TaxID=13616 RepID=UPI0024E1B951|nr:synaptonemal complex protein 2-like [Monodelphis domestica]